MFIQLLTGRQGNSIGKCNLSTNALEQVEIHVQKEPLSCNVGNTLLMDC